MQHFLAERYLARQDGPSLALEAGRVRDAATRLADVRLITTVYVPVDETCFYLLESESAESAAAAGDFDRIVPVTVAEPS